MSNTTDIFDKLHNIYALGFDFNFHLKLKLSKFAGIIPTIWGIVYCKGEYAD